MELVLKHRMLGRVKEQLKHFLVGFYEVIPEALLTIFDFQELELLMCGLPTISLEDWKKNTDYAGELERKGDSHKVAQWFWSVLEEFEDDQKASLLQFVTGTSGVPSQVHTAFQTKHIHIAECIHYT
jgi:HECT-domain (ubiquitin-transferase)